MVQPREDQDQGVLQGIGPAGVGAGQLGEPLGLLLAVGGLTTQVLNHPAGGNRCAEAFRYGLGCKGSLVAFLGQQGGLQLGEGLGAAVLVVGFQLLSELADGGGELLGLDAETIQHLHSTLRRSGSLWQLGIEAQELTTAIGQLAEQLEADDEDTRAQA
ncbi:MAG: hypothetical protein ACKOPS_15125, partial [Cyanobium sp.]